MPFLAKALAPLSRRPYATAAAFRALRRPETMIDASTPQQHGSYHLSLGPVDIGPSYGLESGALRLTRWTSKQSGLRVVHIDHPGPLVNGYFTVATEIFNDDGIPHTLEHLIFLGSELYPYKGVLDSLANRAFANGTNAWTDTTNTSYTVTTAGQEGFLSLLPVYLDHILYPTITDAGFTTEVYHVNGKGEDSGVVYSEMQGRENGSGDLMELKAQRALYGPESGYRSETGGLMEALRKLTAQQIRDYHAGSYLPHNMTLIVTGRVDANALLEVLETEIEPRIAKHEQNRGERPAGWTRPWVETPSIGKPKVRDEVERIVFPEKDESSGEWMASWTGPDSQDFDNLVAIGLLGSYLYDGAISPLYRELVEIDEPYCTDIYLDVNGRSTSILSISASSVPTERLDEMTTKVREVLSKVATDGLDMQRMHSIIERDRLKLVSAIESSAADIISDAVIRDFLFGPSDGSHLADSVDATKRYDKFSAWSAEQWRSLLKQWLVDAPALSIIAKPSAKLSDTLQHEVEKREAKRRKTLGDSGLKKLETALEAARKENDRPIPDDMLASFPIPDAKRLEWIPVQSARARGLSTAVRPEQRDADLERHLAQDPTELPYFVQFDHVSSAFIVITLHLFPQIPPHLRSLLPLWLETFFSLPITRPNGAHLSFEEVVRELDRETVEYGIDAGEPLTEQIRISIKVPRERYARAVEWLRDLLWHSEFNMSRLTVNAAKLKQMLPAEKREGEDVSSAAFDFWTSDPKTSSNLGNNLITRDEALPVLVQRLKDEPEKVVADLEAFRQAVSDPSAMRIAVRGDILSVAQPVKTFRHAFGDAKADQLKPVVYGKDTLSALGKKPEKKAIIYSLASIESSYASYVCRGIDRFDHPDRPALIVAMSVLNALESFLWRYIRGAGLAYGASIRSDIDSGFVYFRVYKSPDCSKAFASAREVIEKIVKGELAIDQLTLESSIASLAYTFASQEATVGSAANSSFSNQVLYGVSRDYAQEMLAKVQHVTVEQVVESIRTYILPAFDPKTSIAFVAAGTSKSNEIATSLAGFGYETEIKKLAGSDEDESGEEDESWEEVEGESEDEKV